MSAADDDLARLQGLGNMAVPAPQPLPPELLPVLPFPVAALPDAFSDWVRDVSERMNCPPDFVAVPLLVAAASLVARQVGIRPERRTDWMERGNLWALIVGRPRNDGSHPPWRRPWHPSNAWKPARAEDFNAQASLHQAQAMAAKLRSEANVKAARKALSTDDKADVLALLSAEDESAAPTRRRYVVNDLTYEKAGEVLEAKPLWCACWCGMNCAGCCCTWPKKKRPTARGFYLQGWSGGRYTFDRIGARHFDGGGCAAVDHRRHSARPAFRDRLSGATWRSR